MVPSDGIAVGECGVGGLAIRRRLVVAAVIGRSVPVALAAILIAFFAGSVWAATINGTARDDTLRGSVRADTLNGKGGNDRLFGAGGNDVLVGGSGNDLLVGGIGADTLRCGPGRDTATRDRRDTVARDCEVVRGPKAVPSPPPQPPPPVDSLYVALGDSIAVGVGASSRDVGFVSLYFARLRAGGLVLRLSNRAENGATAASVLAVQLPMALNDIGAPSDTRLVTLTVGANDSANALCRPANASGCPFASNLRTIVDRLLEALAGDPGDEQIQLMDRYNFGVGTERELDRAGELLGADGRPGCGDTGWNDVIYCVAVEKGATFVNTYTPMLEGGRPFLADSIHPNDSGHVALAEILYRALTLPPIDSAAMNGGAALWRGDEAGSGSR